MSFNPQNIRTDFPILENTIRGKSLVYLDNSATSQIPIPVTNAIVEHMQAYNANVHRGIHYLSEHSSFLYEESRQCVAAFLNAPEVSNIVFTQSTTDSINLVATSFEKILKPEDCILTTQMEHHSNFIPWQQICAHTGANFCVIPLVEDGSVCEKNIEQYFTPNTKLLAISHCSNVTGIMTDIKQICALAHAHNIPVLVDGAQGCVHSPVDVQDLDCDFYCFSGHKLMSPTGIGVLYAKRNMLEKMQPTRYGGGMVSSCSIKKSTWDKIPQCFEAGTPNYIGATGLKAAIQYRNAIGISEILEYENELMTFLENGLKSIPNIHILGETKKRTGCISFSAKQAHSFDVAMLLDQLGIAIRSGHHCAMPLLSHFHLEHAIRISPSFFNTKEELAYFLSSLEKVLNILGQEKNYVKR